MSRGNEPLRETMCATCPFKHGSKYAYLAEHLAESAKKESSRVCHSTGTNNAINKRTGFDPHLCRGARDIQLQFMFAMGAIDKPTDEAWNEARERIGMEPIVIKDPEVRQ